MSMTDLNPKTRQQEPHLPPRRSIRTRGAAGGCRQQQSKLRLIPGASELCQAGSSPGFYIERSEMKGVHSLAALHSPKSITSSKLKLRLARTREEVFSLSCSPRGYAGLLCNDFHDKSYSVTQLWFQHGRRLRGHDTRSRRPVQSEKTLNLNQKKSTYMNISKWDVRVYSNCEEKCDISICI